MNKLVKTIFRLSWIDQIKSSSFDISLVYVQQICLRRIVENFLAFFLITSFFSLASPLSPAFAYLYVSVGLAVLLLRGYHAVFGLFLGVFYSIWLVSHQVMLSLMLTVLTIGLFIFLYNLLMKIIGPTCELLVCHRTKLLRVYLWLFFISFMYGFLSVLLLNYFGVINFNLIGYYLYINTMATLLGVVLFYPCLLRMFNILPKVSKWLAGIESKVFLLICLISFLLTSFIVFSCILVFLFILFNRKIILLEKQILLMIYSLLITSSISLKQIGLGELSFLFLLWLSLGSVIFYQAILRNSKKNASSYTF